MGLKIAINCSKVEGPYGGVNQFANNLESFLASRGHSVYRRLVSGLDIILIVSSKTNNVTTSFTPGQVSDYLLLYPKTMVVQRVNTCDEQRASDSGINRTIIAVNSLADHTVFVSDFLRQLYFSQGLDRDIPNSVIHTGVDERVFNPDGRSRWTPGEKMHVVTHHWSSNYMKGFDTYERFDLMLGMEEFKRNFSFRFIGNLPPGFNFLNTEILAPLSGIELADKLKECHLYLTGTRHEPGGNHYIEAMRCGLPVLYLESGSTGEYCAPYGGTGFNPVNFESRLRQAYDRIDKTSTKVLDCPFSNEWMGTRYEEFFEDLVAGRKCKTAGHRQPLRYFSRKTRNSLSGLCRSLIRALVKQG